MSQPLGRALAIFQEAIEFTGEDRAAYLDQACGSDSDLRREVEDLLGLDAAEDQRFGETQLGQRRQAIADLVPTPAGMPERIGEYRVLRLLGRGGMGVVYEAEQEHPRRSVALKVLAAHALSDSVQRRFRHEATLLGLLKHDGIAQIYDAGTFDTDHGVLPFFAMEFVEGMNLREWSRAKGRKLTEKLELFASICDAVHHAHQKGVVHRDLKPENILVTELSQPKVLDFGVARATDTDLELTTLNTNVGQLVGTVAYMSPEQASGNTDEIDSRSDIYSLGVNLFELLAEQHPHGKRKRSIPELIRAIQEEDPDTLAGVDTSFRGDLDTIVRHALEKLPERRYPSAAQLAEDVRRFLAHEPIQAQSPSAAYQIKKFARRHRGLTVGLVLAFVSQLIGLLVALNFAGNEASARRQADDRLEESERVAYRMSIGMATEARERGHTARLEQILAEAQPERRGWEWRHVAAQLDGHLWEADVLHGFQLQDARPRGVDLCFTPDESLVLAPLDERTLGAFDVQSGLLAFSIDAGPGLMPLDFAASDEHVLIASGKTLRVFELRSGAEVASVEFDQPITALDLASDGRRIVVATGDEALSPDDVVLSPGEEVPSPSDEASLPLHFVASTGVLSSDPTTPLRFEPLIGYAHVIREVQWAEGGNQLVVARDRFQNTIPNLTLTSVDADTGRELATWSGPGDRPYTTALATSADAGVLVAGSYHQFSDLFDLRNVDAELEVQDPVQRFIGHVQTRLRDAAVTPDGSRAISVSEDEMRVWDVATNQQVAAYASTGSASCAISASGRFVVVAGGGRLRAWDLEISSSRVLEGHDTYVYSLEYGPGGDLLASLGFDRRLLLWDPYTGSLVGEIDSSDRHMDTPRHMVSLQWTWSGDGRSLIAATQRHWLRAPAENGARFEAERDSTLDQVPTRGWGEFAGRTASTQRFIFEPDGPLVLDVARGRLFDTTGQREAIVLEELVGRSGIYIPTFEYDPVEGFPFTLVPPALAGEGAYFSPDGARLVVSRLEGTYVFETATGKVLGRLEVEDATVIYGLAWSPDGSRIASGSSDGEVRIWHPETFETLAILRGHTQYVHDVAWSPDGTQLASASGDGTIRLWDSLSVAERHAGSLTRTTGAAGANPNRANR